MFGKALPPGDPKAALAAGIGIVHQHSTLADNLSVLDNVVMGTEPLLLPFTRKAQARQRLLQVAQDFGLQLDPDALVGRLSVGERQRVEITKALYRGARILILDEPTAVLTPQESEALFAVLTRMVQQGLSIIFISHKLAEVLRVAQRVAVLRAGKLVAQAAAQHTTQAQLAEWMVGHAVDAPQRRPARQTGGEVCAMQQISTAPARERLHNVCLRLHAGEIVAIAGVSGNGQVALAEVLCGTRRISHGTLQWQGQRYPHQAAALVQRGIARIPEDRHGQGLIGDLPVWENAVSERLRSSLFSRWGWVRRRAARAYAQQLLARFDVRGAGIYSNARLLSGGNMQKLIVGRALLHPLAAANDLANSQSPNQSPNQSHNPQLIIAHQPTWGLDIGAVAFVHEQLLAARDAGAAVLLISDDLDEVLALGDRVAVMHVGQLTEARPAADWSRQRIGLAMAGAQEGAA